MFVCGRAEGGGGRGMGGPGRWGGGAALPQQLAEAQGLKVSGGGHRRGWGGGGQGGSGWGQTGREESQIEAWRCMEKGDKDGRGVGEDH